MESNGVVHFLLDETRSICFSTVVMDYGFYELIRYCLGSTSLGLNNEATPFVLLRSCDPVVLSPCAWNLFVHVP